MKGRKEKREEEREKCDQARCFRLSDFDFRSSQLQVS